MKKFTVTSLLLGLSALFLQGCTSTPEIKPENIPKEDSTHQVASADGLKLVQMDFISKGANKDYMNSHYQGLAKSIAKHPGVVWKIWTVNEATEEGGGIYLFNDDEAMHSYLEMHIKRLRKFGIKGDINVKTFEIPNTLTSITRGQLNRSQAYPIKTSKDLSELRLVQMDFINKGPNKDEMDSNYQPLAQNIADYPGLIWKIWTANDKTNEGGGIYLFEDKTSMSTYLDMHTKRLRKYGVKEEINIKEFSIPEVLTRIDFGPIPAEKK